MKVSIDVYTKDVKDAAEAFTAAFEQGAEELSLNKLDDWSTKEFESFNLRFNIEHTAPIMTLLEGLSFSTDASEL